jgi:hypothetical protein
MSDLDLIAQALRDNAWWFESSDDHAEVTIGYAMRRLAERIEEVRESGDPPCGNCGRSMRQGDRVCLSCRMAGA